ncbi:Ig-like domain-containing protein [Flavobacterium hydrophilum]|uniref:Secretion protein n=1 Tax=Flavobacterium hydrophilum TaxID=2211445 RepID=A0A2V4C1B0_9FLAO|nr:Ig-like domain-containing protein [Flavobacterium hydrophilum]PXY44925.1 secretion protein [Flavobacterium hydrophilum]
MKKNKLLVIIILLGFLTFGMKYSGFINENFVAPLAKQLTEPKKESVNKTAEIIDKPFLTKQKTNADAAVAASISVTNAVVVNGGGNAVPGSQLDFTLTLTNSGTDDALGTTFQNILDANLTYVPGSLKVTPIAVNDNYNSIGNVGITVNAAAGVLANDISPDVTALTVAILANPTNGTAVLNPNGSFTYNSTSGYSGTDSFTYTLTNSNGKTSIATVNITVSAPIFFVNSSVATSGNGTLSSPFKTVQEVPVSATASIFVYTGTGSSGTALTLSNNQKLIGQGATASLTSILGISVPAYSNPLPSTGGTSPNFSVLNLKLNNDVEGITLTGTNATMAGTSVGTLKVRDVTITGGTAIPVNIAAGGVLDCIFKSISANGASKGISVANSTGSFQVTGIGTTAGSGGTIQNIINRGAEFISCTNVTLKNINFLNANTGGACSTPAVDNSNCNGAIHLKTVTGVTLDNISITGTNNATGININNVTTFSLANSTLTGCGSNTAGSEVGGIYALNLGGTSSITNTNVNDSWGRGFYGYNGILSTNPTLNLTVTGCQFKNSFNKANGASNFIFQGYGTSNNTITLKGNDFSNAKTYGLSLNFGGSSVNNIQVGGNLLADGNTINAAVSSPGSNGLELQSTGTSTVSYNVINNTIKSSFNGSFTCNIGNQGTGTMKGRINNNTIEGGGTASVSNGISVAAYGNAKHITEILNNTITNISNYGIISESNDNGLLGNARIDATIKNNNISLVTNAYAHVGVIAIGNIASSTLISAANIGGNTTNSPVTGLAAGAFDVLSLGANSQIILQGTTALSNGPGDRTTALTNFWNSNNSESRTAIDEQGGGTIVSGTALIPDNPSAAKFAPTPVIEESASITEIQNKAEDTSTAKNNNTAKITSGETITVGPFTLPAGKSTIITFSATVNAANSLPVNTCAVTNQASVSGTNFTTVNSNVTTTSIKPANATFTNTTENIPCLGTATVSLNATCPLGTTPTWYTSITGGTSFATGASVTATPTANNTTYCVACEAAYCASDILLVKTVTGTPSTSSSQTVSACDNYFWSENSTTYTTSGTYTNTVGCDTKTLNLTINYSSAINTAVTKNSDILTATQSGATYQWYQCPNTLLSGETNQSYTALAIGDYKVDITLADCTVTSNCVTISSLAVDDFERNEFKIYPNPSKGVVNIITPYEGNYIIVDGLGKTIKSFDLHENILNTLNLENVSDGTYFIKNISDSNIKTQKLIIQK